MRLACAALIALSGSIAVAAAAERPAEPEGATDPAACTWEWQQAADLGVWTERCELSTGLWLVTPAGGFSGFVVSVDGQVLDTVLQVFEMPPEAGIEAILPELRAAGLIPDDNDCMFVPAAIRPAPRTIAFYEIRPTGARLSAFEATPDDLVPEPPCGAYGWSTHGVRYFMTDLRAPGRVVYVNTGQDGLMFDPATVTLLPTPRLEDFLGTWQLVATRAAPWAGEIGGQPASGAALTVSEGAIAGPAPLACSDASQEVLTVPPEGLFQGMLADQDAAGIAESLGLGLDAPTLRVTCSVGVFDIHRTDGGIVLALDNRLLFFERH